MKQCLLIIITFACFINAASGQKKDSIYNYPPLMPEYRGGPDAMKMFIARNKRYPEKEKRVRKEGRIWVSAIVDTAGILTNIRLARGVSAGFDSEALSLIRIMPAWLPGYTDSGAVRTQINIPVDFTLADTAAIVYRDLDTPVNQKPAMIYKFVERMPSWNDKRFIPLNSYLGNAIRFLPNIRNKEIHDRAYVSFVINEQGIVTQPVIAKTSGNEELDKALLHVVSSMPTWIPGYQNGKAVKVNFTIVVPLRP